MIWGGRGCMGGVVLQAICILWTVGWKKNTYGEGCQVSMVHLPGS